MHNIFLVIVDLKTHAEKLKVIHIFTKTGRFTLKTTI